MSSTSPLMVAIFKHDRNSLKIVAVTEAGSEAHQLCMRENADEVTRKIEALKRPYSDFHFMQSNSHLQGIYDEFGIEEARKHSLAQSALDNQRYVLAKRKAESDSTQDPGELFAYIPDEEVYVSIFGDIEPIWTFSIVPVI